MNLSNPQAIYCYAINAADRITFVDDAWVAFARENDEPALSREAVIGRPILDFISDPATEGLYEMLFERIRSLQKTITVPFRCDGPEVRRYMELVMRPGEGAEILFESVLLHSSSRPAVSLLDVVSTRTDEFLRICSWCKRVNVDDTWVEVEEALGRLRLFERKAMPRLTHGVCEMCERRVLEEIDNA